MKVNNLTGKAKSRARKKLNAQMEEEKKKEDNVKQKLHEKAEEKKRKE